MVILKEYRADGTVAYRNIPASAPFIRTLVFILSDDMVLDVEVISVTIN